MTLHEDQPTPAADETIGGAVRDLLLEEAAAAIPIGMAERLSRQAYAPRRSRWASWIALPSGSPMLSLAAAAVVALVLAALVSLAFLEDQPQVAVDPLPSGVEQLEAPGLEASTGASGAVPVRYDGAEKPSGPSGSF